jgi:membrane associated rhomboid family serine protease
VIGASGALAGNVSAYLMLTPRAKMWALLFGRIPLHLSAYWVLGVWIVFQIGTAFLGGDEQVAWWSHVGGLAAGAVLVIFMRQRGVPLFERTVPTSNVPPPEQPEALPPGRNDGRGPWG